MKARIVLAGILIWTFIPAARALEWQVTSSVSARVIPRPEPQEARVTAKGLHRLAITEFSVLDALLPVRFRILPGELHEDGQWRDGCQIGWIWASNALSAFCSTKAKTDPCQSAIWDTSTFGQLQLHPQGGSKLSFSRPVFVDCECT